MRTGTRCPRSGSSDPAKARAAGCRWRAHRSSRLSGAASSSACRPNGKRAGQPESRSSSAGRARTSTSCRNCPRRAGRQTRIGRRSARIDPEAGIVGPAADQVYRILGVGPVDRIVRVAPIVFGRPRLGAHVGEQFEIAPREGDFESVGEPGVRIADHGEVLVVDAHVAVDVAILDVACLHRSVGGTGDRAAGVHQVDLLLRIEPVGLQAPDRIGRPARPAEVAQVLGIVDLRIFDISGLVPDHVGAHFEPEIAEVPAIGDPSFDTALAAAVVILVRNEHTTAEHAGQLRGTPRNLVETQRVEIVDLTRECMAEERELHADVDVVPLHPRNGGITPLERHQSVLAGSVAVVVVGTRIVNIRVDVVRHARIGFRIGIRNLDFQIIQLQTCFVDNLF